MNFRRSLSLAILAGVYAIALGAPLVTANSYEAQLRENPESRPTMSLPLGTDELGRDRWARFVYGSRVSLVLGPAAALLSTCIAVLAGICLAFLPRRIESVFLLFLDVFLALPWVFVLIIARSLLPLNVSPEVSLTATFVLVSLLGWPSAARAVRSVAVSLKSTDFFFQAVACGCRRWRLLLVHVVPNLRPVITAKFLVTVPAFIIAEATLGMLGLGISEPLPSWGTQLQELASYRNIERQPWVLFPAFTMIAVIWSLNQISGPEEPS